MKTSIGLATALLLLTGVALAQPAEHAKTQKPSQIDKIISEIDNLIPDIGPLSTLSQNTGNIDTTRDNAKVGETFKVIGRTTVHNDEVQPTLDTGYCSSWNGIDTDAKPTLFVTEEVPKLPEASASSIGTTDSFQLISESGWKRLEDREYSNGQYSEPDIPAGSDVLVYNFTVKADQPGSYAFRLRVPCRDHFDINNNWKIVDIQPREPTQPGDQKPGDGENQTGEKGEDQPPENDLGPVETFFFKIVDVIGAIL